MAATDNPFRMSGDANTVPGPSAQQFARLRLGVAIRPSKGLPVRVDVLDEVVDLVELRRSDPGSAQEPMGVSFDVIVVDDLEGPLGPDERPVRHTNLLDLHSGLRSSSNSMGGNERPPRSPMLPMPDATLATHLP